MLAITDTGSGMTQGDAAAPVRAVLHDQGNREGHRPRPVDDLRHRQAEQRLHLGVQRARPRDDVQGLPAALDRGRRAPDASPGGRRTGQARVGDRAARRRRGRRAPALEAHPRQRRLSRAGSRERGRRRETVRAPRRLDRSGGDRRDHARLRRPRAAEPAAACERPRCACCTCPATPSNPPRTKAGIDRGLPFVQKPFTAAEFVRQVRDALDR